MQRAALFRIGAQEKACAHSGSNAAKVKGEHLFCHTLTAKSRIVQFFSNVNLRRQQLFKHASAAKHLQCHVIFVIVKQRQK